MISIDERAVDARGTAVELESERIPLHILVDDAAQVCEIVVDPAWQELVHPDEFGDLVRETANVAIVEAATERRSPEAPDGEAPPLDVNVTELYVRSRMELERYQRAMVGRPAPCAEGGSARRNVVVALEADVVRHVEVNESWLDRAGHRLIAAEVREAFDAAYSAVERDDPLQDYPAMRAMLWLGRHPDELIRLSGRG